MRDELVSIFILPPSHDELELAPAHPRLRQRGRRGGAHGQGADEISHWPSIAIRN